MHLEIVSPEKTLYSGKAELVTLPGTNGSFTILEHHAPIISSLKKGALIYRANGSDIEIAITGGFVEMNNNEVSVCIDGIQ